MGNHLSGTGITSQPQAALISRFLMVINPLSLAPSRGLPSQHFSMLLVRSYRTLAPLPYISIRRYVSVALSSRLPALGVTQQA